MYSLEWGLSLLPMTHTSLDWPLLAAEIKALGLTFGLSEVGITNTDLQQYEQHLLNYLAKNHHGEMHYMAKHGTLRSRPAELVPGAQRIISVRMDYLPPDANSAKILSQSHKAFISRYALGRDYHKVLRQRLQKFAEAISARVGPFGYRAFVDSAPVLEKALGEKAGLGWIGKNTLLLNKKAGSYFFLGEIFTDLPLPIDAPLPQNYCGRCQACITLCPTQAIIAPYQLDARRCISYLTIEYKGSIPLELRPLMGNRIFGCDDCQMVCPWNRFAKPTREPDFQPRHQLSAADLIDLFAWSEEEFLKKTEGSAIRRATYVGWLRNIAVALGNAEYSEAIVAALKARADDGSELVREHVAWALKRQSLQLNLRK